MKPTLVFVSGAPGSGKTTLARLLAERLRLPHVNRDSVLWGLRWTAGDVSIDAVTAGVPAFNETIGLLLRSGVSVIADATLYRGVSDHDIGKLCLLSEPVNIHCRARNAVDRFRHRELASATRLAPVDALVARVQSDLARTAEPLDLNWDVIEVETTSGYFPSLDDLVARLRRPAPLRQPRSSQGRA